MTTTPGSFGLFKATFAATAVSVLVACGGGGGDAPPSSSTRAEGVYAGTLTGSSSSAFELLVLENDEYWGLYGTNTASTFFVAGFIQGTGTSNNGSFTSSNARDFGTDPPASGSVSATYVADTSIKGTIAAPGGSVGFAGTPIVSSSYVYNTPAIVSTISGAWSLTALDGSSVALNVSSSGAFSGSTSGCLFSGTLTPRTSGKNVFNVALTFGGAPCALPNQPASGVAVSYLLANGVTRQIIIAGTNSARTSGTALFGTR